MEHEAVFGEMISMAQAARRAGGIVIAQVKRMALRGTLPPKQVKIPGMLVDLIVVDPEQTQTFFTVHDPAYAGETQGAASATSPHCRFRPRKMWRGVPRWSSIAAPSAISAPGSRPELPRWRPRKMRSTMSCSPTSRASSAACRRPAMSRARRRNYQAMVDQPYQFDFYDGGGLDLAFLSFAEVDEACNVNVSRFGDKIIGPGGFINISQNAKTMIFSGTFTAGGLDIAWTEGRRRSAARAPNRNSSAKCSR